MSLQDFPRRSAQMLSHCYRPFAAARPSVSRTHPGGFQGRHQAPGLVDEIQFSRHCVNHQPVSSRSARRAAQGLRIVEEAESAKHHGDSNDGSHPRQGEGYTDQQERKTHTDAEPVGPGNTTVRCHIWSPPSRSTVSTATPEQDRRLPDSGMEPMTFPSLTGGSSPCHQTSILAGQPVLLTNIPRCREQNAPNSGSRTRL